MDIVEILTVFYLIGFVAQALVVGVLICAGLCLVGIVVTLAGRRAR